MDNYKNKEWLKKAFEIYGNKQAIGRICGVSGDTIEYWRKKFNISKSTKGKQAARKHTINQSYAFSWLMDVFLKHQKMDLIIDLR